MPTHPSPTPPNGPVIAIGRRVLAILAIAVRARLSPLLVGPPGIGKSELFHELGRLLGIEIRVIDLSLCEPSDLVGLPRQENGRTVFSPPASLPTGGRGVLVFEELNRAEKFIQGPVLQLLTARRLNDYELPAEWVCAAAINPDDGHHDVRALDPAMLSRFLIVTVGADRSEWLAWARSNGIHPAVLHVVAADSASFDSVPPRSWTHASNLLLVMTAEERNDDELLHQTLAGVLPEAWVVVLTGALRRVRDGDLIAVDVLRHCATDASLRQRLTDLRDRGRTDVLKALTGDLSELLRAPLDLARLTARHDFTLENFEAMLPLLPGDLRTGLQEALAEYAAAVPLLGVDYHDMLSQGYRDRGYDWRVGEWQRDENTHHRVGLFVTGLRMFLHADANLAAVRRGHASRRALGAILADLQPRFRQTLLDCLATLRIEPILIDRRS